MSRQWTANDLPSLAGKTVVVTGGNSGLGYHTSLALAGKGARVILACRDQGKADVAASAIRTVHPSAAVEVMPLDLARLASVQAFATAFCQQHQGLDVLCNNAGVMALPYRKTADGFEMQLGTNHLGHFALTGQLLDLLRATPGARVVNVSSGMHRLGRMRFDDLQGERSYHKWLAYGQSKLANLLFTYELQRRLTAAALPVISIACHPGFAATNLQAAGPRMAGSALMERLSTLGARLFAQAAEMGALPTLYAIAAEDVQGGDYIGPDGLGEMRGHPRKVRSNRRSHDPEAARRLWELSEQLTGVHYGL